MTTLRSSGHIAGTTGLSSAALRSDDPVFAAIARHRKAYTAHAELFEEWNSNNQDPPAVLARAAGEAEAEALNTLLATTPMTLAGAVAVCRYIAECQPPDVPSRSTGCIFWEGEERKIVAFLQRLADCMAKHA
jgi:hypothetical protein